LHTCARLADNRVRCLGANESGQLGNGTNAASAAPVTVIGLGGVAQVVASGGYTCACYGDGYVTCWGTNYSDQLGQPHSEILSVLAN
jgi:alpha-tubulin suppressor-like RCC1 family protein